MKILSQRIKRILDLLETYKESLPWVEFTVKKDKPAGGRATGEHSNSSHPNSQLTRN